MAVDNHHAILMGKSTIEKWSFTIATLNHKRVHDVFDSHFRGDKDVNNYEEYFRVSS